MTDWERVARLRKDGRSWDEIAHDPKVGFRAESGADPGRSLKVLYYRRRSDAGAGRTGSQPRSSSSARRSSRYSMGRRTALAGGVGAAAVIGIVVYLVFFYAVAPSTASAMVSYCGGEGTAAHYHVLLVINDNGVQQHLPYDPSQPTGIGITNQPGYTNPAYYCAAGGIHALHTHDGSGIIHLEIPAGISLSPAPTLGEFFTIWGEPLSNTAVWSFSGHVTAQVVYTGAGSSTDYSSNPGSVPMPVPAGGPYSNPYPIPQNLIFSGVYGNGASGGTFSGEIVWLNVTA